MSATVAVMVLVPALAAAPPGKAQASKRYEALARRIHQLVAKDLKKPFEDRSAWGTTIPIPPRLPFPRLKRTTVMVNGKEQLPHGGWVRTKVWLDDPAKDLRIEVLDVRRPANKPIQLELRVSVSGHFERERQQWRRGVMLLGLTTQGDGKVELRLSCDVEVKLNTGKFPPAVELKPTVAAASLELKEFTPRRVNNTPVEVVLDKATAEELKKTVNGFLKDHQEQIKELANRVLGEILKEGKGRLPALDLLKP
jgi:hypothetical protein